MIVLVAVVLLILTRNSGVLGYLIQAPPPLDVNSLYVLGSFGAVPLILALLMWAAAWGLGRRALVLFRSPPEGRLDGITAASLGLGLMAQSVFLMGWGACSMEASS